MGGLLLGFPGAQDGLSAYEIAVANGFVGTELQWLTTLIGPQGLSAYQLAQSNGYAGTLTQWLASLVGPQGKSAYQSWLAVGNVGTEAQFIASLQANTNNLGQVTDWAANNGMGQDTPSYGITDVSGYYTKIGKLVHIECSFRAIVFTPKIKLPFKALTTNQFNVVPYSSGSSDRRAQLTANSDVLTIDTNSSSGTIWSISHSYFTF